MATVLFKNNYLYINFINKPNKEEIIKFQKSIENTFYIKINVIVIFDTTNLIDIPSINTCYKYAKILNKMKNFVDNYVTKAIIIYNNDKIINIIKNVVLKMFPTKVKLEFKKQDSINNK
jgi:hypothetical protein